MLHYDIYTGKSISRKGVLLHVIQIEIIQTYCLMLQ